MPFEHSGSPATECEPHGAIKIKKKIKIKRIPYDHKSAPPTKWCRNGAEMVQFISPHNPSPGLRRGTRTPKMDPFRIYDLRFAD